MIRYFPTTGDRHGWAIDEDLRMIRESLAGVAVAAPLGMARVVHCPFWMALAMHSPRVLAHRFVISHADNPPFFYLTQPEFLWAQQVVDLWVARSHEALAQFEALGLPAALIPYAIDEELFQPWPHEPRILRERYSLPDDAYIIGNFHRDSEGADLSRPKTQKSPEVLVEICERARAQGVPVHVLLAGPRRHWIRHELARRGIPMTFVGDSSVGGDDFGPNIVSRQELSLLYNACDLYVIPSRWEGGPQSVMEAAACRRKILSTRVGVSIDLLEPESLFDSINEAVEKIVSDWKSAYLGPTVEPQFARWEKNHTSLAMAAGLHALYRDLPGFARFRRKPRVRRVTDTAREIGWQIRRRWPVPVPVPGVAVADRPGGVLGKLAERAGLIRPVRPGVVFCGEGESGVGAISARATFLSAGSGVVPSGGVVIVETALDAVNLKKAGCGLPVAVCPFGPHDPGGPTGPVVLERSEPETSRKVIGALRSGRPVIYDESVDVRFPVFHAGIPFGRMRSLDEAGRVVAADSGQLTSQAYLPGDEWVADFLRKLAPTLLSPYLNLSRP